MMSSQSSDDIDVTLPVRPEDILLASVAYNAPEMRSLDSIIAQREQSTAVTPLPVEILLRIRSNLQQELFKSLAEETSRALVQYESTLVEGLCADCYWWNSDIYGQDVWAWVENGYRGPCSCCVVGDNDPRVPSPERQQVLDLYEDFDISSRAQWIRAYVSKKYLQSHTKGHKRAWSFVKETLASFGCEHERKTVPPPKAPTDAAGVIADLKKAQTRNGYATASFGAPVIIRQSASVQQTEDADATLRRLERELAIKPIPTSPCEAVQPSISSEGKQCFFPESHLVALTTVAS